MDKIESKNSSKNGTGFLIKTVIDTIGEFFS